MHCHFLCSSCLIDLDEQMMLNEGMRIYEHDLCTGYINL